MERTEVLELARREAEPAVTIMLPVVQPAAAHPENPLNLRALLTQAGEIVETWWGREAAVAVRRQIDDLDLELGPDESARGLVLLATTEDCRVLRLPFAVDPQVVVDRTFATRQILEGLARHPRFRVLVLAGHRARLLEGRAEGLHEVTDGGFPLEVTPPHEWDAPQRDRPIHEGVASEEHRFVYRAVDVALDAACASDPLPLVVAAAERELAYFDEVTRHGALVVGRVRGNYDRAGPTELAEVVRPAVETYLGELRQQAVRRLREAYGRGMAVTDLVPVRQAAVAGRGHELIVEEGLTAPKHWLGSSGPGRTEDGVPVDDAVDDIIEAVLRSGGTVEFVESGALDDLEHIGLIVRYPEPRS